MIRKANESDCMNIAALSLAVWFQTYCMDGIRTENSEFAISSFTEDYFKKILLDPRYGLLVFVEGIYLRGYVLVNLESRFQSEKTGFEIERLYVQGPFQGRGIGKKLLSEIISRHGNRCWLYTWVKNRSIAFYEKFGFIDIGQYDFKIGKETIKNRVLAYGSA
ncbi:GNAT family N-acetyltransferase [Desulfospira joergensenii]|uniref:GNAT family N-acetyltransferase n=1 Tax=Desulfospira joergensenii TaxID=53329 RepID=UPI0003B718A1|nr:GNAT family N-acetyltransferase [Desulfospira joergensenii]